MTVDLGAALADATTLQATKLDAGITTDDRAMAGPGPDRQMPYIAALPARELFVDETYQRALDRSRVASKVREWDPTMLGVLDVSDRGPHASPRYAIVNGQHRRAIAVAADPRGEDVPLVCNVHRGLTLVDEAALMYELDRGTKALTSWDKWKARRTAGEQVVLDITDIATRHGMVVSPGSFGATGAAEKLWNTGGRELLAAVVSVLIGAYGSDPAAMKAPLLTATGAVLTKYAQDVNADRLHIALRKTSPQQLIAAAFALREVEGGSLNANVARAITGQYNRTAGPGPRLEAGRA